MRLERLRTGKWPQTLLMFCALALPVAGYCDAGPGWLQRISASMGGHANDVAVKVAELPEKYSHDIVNGVAFSADGNQIAVDASSQFIDIWDWRSGRIVKTIERARAANDVDVTEPLRYSPDGKLFVACHSLAAGDVVARLWNAKTWEVVHDFVDPGAGGCNAIGFTPDGQYLIRVVDRGDSPGDSLIVYKVGTWQLVWGLRVEGFSPAALAISPDGEFIAFGGQFFYTPPGLTKPIDISLQTKIYPQIQIVDMRQRKVVHVIQSDARGAMAWSPDGARIAVVGEQYVEIFDAHTGDRLVHEKLEKSGTMHVRYTPDGRYLLESDLNGRGAGLGVMIWDGQHHKLLQQFGGDVGSIAISRDGKYFAAGETGKTTVWQFK
ncbi:MAG: WD40 repeat domain-containing protein [Rhodoferax sp.]